MPGPNSAPNGDTRLVYEWVWSAPDEKMIPLREKLRRSGKLRSGKTDAKRRK